MRLVSRQSKEDAEAALNSTLQDVSLNCLNSRSISNLFAAGHESSDVGIKAIRTLSMVTNPGHGSEDALYLLGEQLSTNLAKHHLNMAYFRLETPSQEGISSNVGNDEIDLQDPDDVILPDYDWDVEPVTISGVIHPISKLKGETCVISGVGANRCTMSTHRGTSITKPYKPNFERIVEIFDHHTRYSDLTSYVSVGGPELSFLILSSVHNGSDEPFSRWLTETASNVVYHTAWKETGQRVTLGLTTPFTEADCDKFKALMAANESLALLPRASVKHALDQFSVRLVRDNEPSWLGDALEMDRLHKVKVFQHYIAQLDEHRNQ